MATTLTIRRSTIRLSSIISAEAERVLKAISLATQQTRMPMSVDEIIRACDAAGADPTLVAKCDASNDLRGLVVQWPDKIKPGVYSFYKSGGEYGHMTTDVNLASQYGEAREIIVDYRGDRTDEWQMVTEVSGQSLFAPGLPKLLLVWGQIDGVCQVVRLR